MHSALCIGTMYGSERFSIARFSGKWAVFGPFERCIQRCASARCMDRSDSASPDLAENGPFWPFRAMHSALCIGASARTGTTKKQSKKGETKMEHNGSRCGPPLPTETEVAAATGKARAAMAEFAHQTLVEKRITTDGFVSFTNSMSEFIKDATQLIDGYSAAYHYLASENQRLRNLRRGKRR
jgi:hypothetical protein